MKPNQTRKPRLSIRTIPRSRRLFVVRNHKHLITGQDTLGRSIRIATHTRIGAEKVVAAIKQGNHAAIDSILMGELK